jgi:TPR repeat protein
MGYIYELILSPELLNFMHLTKVFMLSTKKVVLSSLLLLSLILVTKVDKLTDWNEGPPSFMYTKFLAVKGVASAQYSLGLMYHFGQGVAQDYKQAIRWYTYSAVQQNVMAQFSLGLMYAKGQGAQDYKKAVYWFQKAAKQGDSAAQLNLGFMYDKGHGVTQDYKEAVYWYEKAARQGDDAARFNLRLIQDKTKGIAQN